MVFKKAERVQTHLKLALAGPSGSGKTYSALRIAAGLAKKLGTRVAVIDTENGSAALYSDKFDFDTLEIEAPFAVTKYAEAVKAAIVAGYRVLVIDSISHQWAGEGGILDKKAKMDVVPGSNSFTNWASLTPEQERFRSLILQSNVHMICTMRSKQAYVLVENDKGKMAPQKMGMEPVQREGMEYEFTTMFDIDMAHHAKPSKDRTGLFDGVHDKLSEEHGEKLFAWWSGGRPAGEKPSVAPDPAPAQAHAQPEAKPAAVPAPQTQPKTAAPERPGVTCTKCGGQVVLHPTRVGYACEKSERRGDGHTRFLIADLPKYMGKVEQQAQAG